MTQVCIIHLPCRGTSQGWQGGQVLAISAAGSGSASNSVLVALGPDPSSAWPAPYNLPSGPSSEGRSQGRGGLSLPRSVGACTRAEGIRDSRQQGGWSPRPKMRGWRLLSQRLELCLRCPWLRPWLRPCDPWCMCLGALNLQNLGALTPRRPPRARGEDGRR